MNTSSFVVNTTRITGNSGNTGFTIAPRPQLPPSSRSIGFKDTIFHGPLLRQQQQHHNIPFAKGWGEEEPFSLRNLRLPIKKVCKKTPSKISTVKILGPEMIILNQYVSLKDQVDIVYMCDKLGAEPEGFYEPYFMKGEDYRIHMCFGRGWDPKTPPVPHKLKSLAAIAVEDAQAHLDQLPSMRPNTCLVCFYPLSCGRIGLHQDRDESGNGSPVVSIFIGEAAVFAYRLCGDNKLKRVLLQSGDVLIYGGKSRHIYHGVTQIYQSMSLPLLQETGIKPGCLNLTLTRF